MKIVGFETNNGAAARRRRGRQVIDLQAVDPKVPTDLGACCAQTTAISSRSPSIAKTRAGFGARARSPASSTRCRSRGPARSSASASTISITSRKARNATTSRNSRRSSCAARPRWCRTAADHPSAGLRDARLRGRAGVDHRQARQASHDGERDSTASPAIPAPTRARSANSSATPRSGTWARTSTAPAASAPGWSPPTSCRRAARASRSRAAAQRQGHAVGQHRRT